MDSLCRLLPDETVNKKTYSDKHKRDAEPLSHIQNHILLESHLRFLDELYEETHSETSDEEGSDEESTMKLRKSVLIHKYLKYTEKEIAQRLIELSRMLRLGLSSQLEDEAPRKSGDITVYF